MASLFVMGLAIDFQDWKRIVTNPKVVGISVLIRWICVPLAAYAIAYASFIALLPSSAGRNLAVGMILLGAAPTGTASNAFTMISRGDLALSVSVTTINTLLAPFLLPLITLWMAGSMTNVDAVAIFEDLLRMVILPVALGTILGSVFVRRLNGIKPALGPIAVICLGMIMMGSMSRGTSTVLKQLYILPYLAAGCVLFAIVTYALGFYLPKFAGFNLKQRKAACFEVAITNAALTMTIALRHFTPLAVVVSILYAKVMVIMGAVVFVPLFQKMEDRETTAEAPLHL
jgi:BASS family bile acid:Na+ symporter